VERNANETSRAQKEALDARRQLAERGMKASCGHLVYSIDDMHPVRYRAYTKEAYGTLYHYVMHSVFCRNCAEALRFAPEFIETNDEASAWLESVPTP
jgi:hypothetical protein